MRGLLYDSYKAYENAYEVYKKLFDSTGEGIYLFREATSSLLAKKHILESIARLKDWDKKHPDMLEVRRLLIPLYLTAREVKSAQKEAEYLLEQSTELVDLDLASNSFLYAGNFKRALELLSKIYETVPNEDVLLKMTEVMDEFTNERKKAIQLLDSHRRMNISSKDIYIKLLILYQKEKDIDGMIEIYKALYEQEESEKYLIKVIDAYVYKGDVSAAISFLEKRNYKGVLLYELYKVKKDFSKALTMIDNFYKKDKNPKWFAEKGMLTFEGAKNKNDKKMIQETVSFFEKAVKLGNDDSLYLNYYGYTLIDKEVDIGKGIKIIEKALVQQPNNTFYLDSLAWGYYKRGKCKEAQILINRVVNEEGLKEKEIKTHWDAIQQCKQKQ
jgi:predicted Zn-dependent protease